MPPVLGGDEIDGQVAPKFQFEDLDVSERRIDVNEPVGADEPVGDLPCHSGIRRCADSS